jgi:aspartate aminotransferase
VTTTADLHTFRPSKNLRHLRPSATVTINQEAKRRKAAGEDIIDLSAGEPDFATPKLIADAGIRAIQEGHTKYPPNHGILDLRAGAARQLSLMSGGRSVNADNIVVSTGAKQAVFNACFALFASGDNVLIPAPAWVSYPQIVHLTRAEPRLVPGDAEWSLKVGVTELERAADANTNGLILCSPNNPTGAVYTRSEIKAIAEWARDRGVWVVADEIYRWIHYAPGPAPSFLDLPDDLLGRVVVISGVSKTYAMTGWRIGFALAPTPVAKAMASLQTHVTSGASHPAQYAAAAAYNDERLEPIVQDMIEQFRRRRSLIVEYFRAHLPGVEFVDPMGAFYFFFRVDSFFDKAIDGAVAFCEQLLATEGLALVPGEAFGDKRWVRVSFAASDADIQDGLERLVRFVGSRGGAAEESKT